MEELFEKEKKRIGQISDYVRSKHTEFVVLLAINTKHGTSADDYENFSVTTEYFSQAELDEIMNGFKDLGCIVDFSNGEKEFVDRLVRGDFKKYDKLDKIVYNSTGEGTGRCRSAFMPALSNLYKLRNCSNDIYSSTIPENKVHFFHLLEYYGYPIPKTWYYDPVRGWLTGEPDKDLLLITKPAYECASVGISENSVSTFSEAYFKHINELAQSMNQPVLVQEFIEGEEVEVPVFDIGEPFTPMSVGINMNGDKNAGKSFLTYDQVYDDKYEFYSYSRHKEKTADLLMKIARDSFVKLGMEGMMRVDFRVNDVGKGFIMDYNNSPHLTEFHSCAFTVKDLGFKYSDMLSLVLYKYVKLGRL